MDKKDNLFDFLEEGAEEGIVVQLGRDADWETTLKTYMDSIKDSNPEFFDNLLLLYNEYSKTESERLEATNCKICGTETHVDKETVKKGDFVSCTKCFVETLRSADGISTHDPETP